MCGVAGIFAYDDRALPVDRDELVDIRDSMAARGPDGAGIWISDDRRAGLAHRRLAIIDLSATGAQPMHSADGALAISFNGEIYNYRELRRELEHAGYRFRSTSDTEVLLALYERLGENMLHRLRGMYAFAIWDARRQEMFLARDPLGIKPLYYCDEAGTLRFASQVKALVKGNGVRLTADPAGHAGFFVFGYVPEPYTLYRQIRALPAGSTLILRRSGRPVLKQFYDVRAKLLEAQAGNAAAAPAEDPWRLVATALDDSVAHHLVSDVPVGIFLSSGVDSSAIACAMRGASSAEHVAITMGFREFVGTANDEVPLAEAQARRLGLRHVTRWVTREEFYCDVARVWRAMDQPSIDGVNTWMVAKAAAEQGLKVSLSGIGGDELFGGYPSFQQVPELVRRFSGIRIPRIAKNFYRLLARRLPERLVSPKYAYALDHAGDLHSAYLLRRALFLPEELSTFLDPQLAREGLAELDAQGNLYGTVQGVQSPHAAIANLELAWYMRSQLLRDTDWAGMAHGLEIRTPMVDVRFFEALLPQLASSRPPSKDVLTRAAGDGVLPEISRRPKTGFSTPVSSWLEQRYHSAGRYRGLRAWSRVVYAEFVPELSLLPADPIPPRLTGGGLVMVYRIGQLGDTLVSLPALQALRKEFAKDQIVLITDRHPERAGLVSAWDVIGPTGICDGVMYYDVFEHTIRNLQVYLQLRKRIRRIAPSAVINLAPRTRTWDERRDSFFFKNLCGVPTYRAASAIAGSRRASAPASVQPEWARLLHAIAPERAEETFTLPIPRWARSEAALALAQMVPGAKHVVAVGPGSKMSAKRWPPDRFLEVGQRILCENADNALVVFGGPEDRALGDELCKIWGLRSLNLAGSVSVFGSAAALSRCAAYVGNDSGAMHLAGFVGVPCIAIFSARDVPGKWVPYGSAHRILQRQTDCAGCMLEVCDRKNLCLTKIETGDVFDSWRGIATLKLASESRGEKQGRLQ
jgi:asparagine synthase (glutamine-hydrolysing)